MSTGRTGIVIGRARLEDAPPDYIEVTADRYSVVFGTEQDADGFVDAVEADGTETDGYRIQEGADWEEADPKEAVEDAAAVHETDVVYVSEQADAPFERSYLAGTDRDPAEIQVTVPDRLGGRDVTPLYDALEPFYDDQAIVAAVEAVDRELDAFEDGENEMIEI